MMTFATGREEGTDLDLDPRDVRALTEYLTVLDDVDRAAGDDDLYLVVSQSGREYLVDVRTGTCECADHEYRGIHCKHARRVEFATGEQAIPAGVEGVDDRLGEHVDTEPRVAATDGGIIVADDEGEILEDDSERPDDCQCWDIDAGLACWACYAAGYWAQNPAEPAADEDGEGQ